MFIYDNFVKYEFWRTVATDFLQSFPDLPEPSKAMIFNLVKKFCIILYWIRNKHEEMLGCVQTDRASHSVSLVALKAMHCTMLISCPHQIIYAMQSAVLGLCPCNERAMKCVSKFNKNVSVSAQ